MTCELIKLNNHTSHVMFGKVKKFYSQGNPVVGAVGEMSSVKRRKLWKTGEDGLCCSSSAIQTRLGPSSLLEERSGVTIVFVVLLCCRLPPKLGEMAKVYR